MILAVKVINTLIFSAALPVVADPENASKIKSPSLEVVRMGITGRYSGINGGAEGFDHFRPDFHISEGRKFLTTL